MLPFQRMNPSTSEKLIRNGLVHVYTGSGKGKTTCALGVALRVIGWSGRACMVQFIKAYSSIGEAEFAEKYPDRFVLRQFAIDLSRNIDEAKVRERKRAVDDAMAYAQQAISSGDFDLVILDEINNAMHYGLLDVARVLDLIESRPRHVEIVLTGRSAPAEIIEAADYVTEMTLVKHPFERGVQARKGIDY